MMVLMVRDGAVMVVIYDGTGTVEGGKLPLVMVDTGWCWVSIGRYWLVLGGSGSVEGGTRSV